MKLKIILSIFCLPIFLYAQTISLDQEHVVVHLKNNSTNILKFPFVIQKANLTTESPDDFSVVSKNYAVVVIPTAVSPEKESGDLLVWSAQGDPYLIELKSDGKTDKVFTIASNKIKTDIDQKAALFETGKIESDIKKLIKKMVLGEKIPGYKKVNVKKQFITPDLKMQKDFFYDGGKYRVEQWFIKNTTQDTLMLEYRNFYSPGILAISFEKQILDSDKITKAWLIIDKHTVYKKIKDL